MRYIHDGTVQNRTIDPPVAFVFDEANTRGTGRTNTALETAAMFGPALAKVRKREGPKPLLIGHDRDRWRWTDE